MICKNDDLSFFFWDPFQLHTCQSSLWIALCWPSGTLPQPPPPPSRPLALPALHQDSRAPTLPAPTPALPSLPRSTAPLPLHPQAHRLLGEWPQPSQVPSRHLEQQACRVERLRMDPSQTRRAQGEWLKMDRLLTSLKDPLRAQRGS